MTAPPPARAVLRALAPLLEAGSHHQTSDAELLRDVLNDWQIATHQPLRLDLVAGGWFANDELIHLDPPTYPAALALARRCAALGVGTLSFPLDCTPRQISGFIDIITGRYGLAMIPAIHVGVQVASPAPDPLGNGDTHLPGLANCLGRAVESLRRGPSHPDLLPIKRILTQIDHAQGDRSWPAPAGPQDPVVLDVLHALAFGTWLRLSPSWRLALTLSAVLIRMPGGHHPDAITARAAGCSGLGQQAEPILLTLHTAATCLAHSNPQPAAACSAGELLALVLRFREYAATEHLGAARAIQKIERRWGTSNLSVQLLVAWIRALPQETTDFPDVEIIDEDVSSFLDGGFSEDDPTDRFTEDTVRRWRGQPDPGEDALPDPDRWVPRRFRRDH